MRYIRLLVILGIVNVVQAQPSKTGAPPLRSIDAPGIHALRNESRGSVLLLNFWATWCEPCVEEFPGIVKLQKSYGTKGLKVVFVSIDDDDNKTKRTVSAFLKKMNVESLSYIKKGGDDEQFINAVNTNWSGALPATLVYDRQGKLAALKVEQVSSSDLEHLVQPLLGR